ncbi:MAG: CPXCG motif-containing cysteine-rich protein [Acidobacteria bacterium]|nr:CPXCG motif-containing cysteine-rich protein [Acidobacteriota bacterium]
MNSEFHVTCPYCGEEVDIYLEPEMKGVWVQDCEVCCNPWQLRLVRDADGRSLEVTRADGSE